MKEENKKTKKPAAKTSAKKSTKTSSEKKGATVKKVNEAKKGPKTAATKAKTTKTKTTKTNSKDTKSKTTAKKVRKPISNNIAANKEPVKKEEVKQEKVVEKKEDVTKENNNVTKTVIILVLVALLLGILFFISEKNNDKFVQPETFSEEEQADLKSITVDDYLSLKTGSEPSVIYIARPTCSHCVTQTPRMKYIKYKYGVEINYLNTDEFDEEGKDYEKLASSDSFFDEGFGTPTILIVQNDKIIDSVSGESEISNLVELFKSHNLIKE